MSSYQLQTLSYKGLQITPNEKSFLEILHAKVIDPRAHKSEIESEEKRLIQEVNLRRHGELVRPKLPDFLLLIKYLLSMYQKTMLGPQCGKSTCITSCISTYFSEAGCPYCP